MKECCLTSLGFLIYASCYAVPYFVSSKKVADLLVDGSGQYVYGLDVTLAVYWYILGGVFAGLLIAAGLVFCIVKQFGESIQTKIRLPILLYWIFSVLPSVILLVLSYKVYGKTVPCDVNTTVTCQVSGANEHALAHSKFEAFDAYSVMVVHLILVVLVGCEWFAKFKENDYEMKYIFFAECGAEFLPIYDISEMWNLLMQKEVLLNDILLTVVVISGVTSMLRFVPTPQKVDESGELRPKRVHVLVYLLGHELPFFIIRVVVVVLNTSKTILPWNYLIFIMKNGLFSISYMLLLCLLNQAAPVSTQA
ncbi:uncharacterized protein LOC106180788 [Lingula anatina]|uniref:Uncharacterized protein LOC106180788 n=1 Tax=Lingula anatina TaxID=7574 RepID=A0A1S3KD38_LINAN|nr:uncharacterized protein LOC106180788 [Lingula anatina]|eukprot:XP_013420369.1 uncharacterized protein LOC106180788 [Lingula anatina]